MYGPGAAPSGTGGVRNWNEAVAFCKNQGQLLASWSDYCDSTDWTASGSTLTLRDLGQTIAYDHWSPIADYPNGWIQTGDTSGVSYHHPKCDTHREGGHGDPTWGEPTDTTKSAFEAQYILCKNVQEFNITFEVSPYYNVNNWDEAARFCLSTGPGVRLAEKEEICDNASEIWDFTLPVSHTDQWSPISNYPNGWVQTGDGGYHITNVTHRDAGWGDPLWGLDEQQESFESNYIFCTKPCPNAGGGC